MTRFHVDIMTQQLAEPLDDREPQSQTLGVFTRGIVDLMIFIEDQFQLCLGNSNSGVPDLDAHILAAMSAAQQNPAGICVFERVGEQIAQHLLKHPDGTSDEGVMVPSWIHRLVVFM